MQTPHINHLRYRSFGRVRHSSRLLAWLGVQADRLGESASDVFERLRFSSARAVETAEPSEPEEPEDPEE